MDYSAQSNVYKTLMEELLADKHILASTRAHYHYAYQLLAKYLDNEHFLVNDLTENRMTAFIKHLKTTLSEGTIHTACAKIAAVCHYAMAKGLLQPSDYCFQTKPYAKMVRKSNKKAFIDKDNLRRTRPAE